MRIYKVKPDVTKCQLIQRDDNYELVNFDCLPKKEDWLKDDWYIYDPIKPKTHFYITAGSTIIFDEVVYNSDLLTLFEISGEVLPIEIENEKYYFINVTNCINALDKEKTKYHFYPDGSKGRIKDFIFHSNRVGGPPLFKIPETRKVDILCSEGIVDSWDEFKGRYDELGFTGLKFTEIYDSEKI